VPTKDTFSGGSSMRRSVCVATIAALPFVAAPTAHALPARQIAGVAVHPWRMEDARRVEHTFADIAATGAKWGELWNEPNFQVFAKPRPDPAGFVGFLQSADRVRDRVRPGAKLISGGLAPGTDIGIVDWVDQMARLGGLELVDGLGVHPYSPLRSDDPEQADRVRSANLPARKGVGAASDRRAAGPAAARGFSRSRRGCPSSSR
jgi:hypothetical protein